MHFHHVVVIRYPQVTLVVIQNWFRPIPGSARHTHRDTHTCLYVIYIYVYKYILYYIDIHMHTHYTHVCTFTWLQGLIDLFYSILLHDRTEELKSACMCWKIEPSSHYQVICTYQGKLAFTSRFSSWFYVISCTTSTSQEATWTFQWLTLCHGVRESSWKEPDSQVRHGSCQQITGKLNPFMFGGFVIWDDKPFRSIRDKILWIYAHFPTKEIQPESLWAGFIKG